MEGRRLRDLMEEFENSTPGGLTPTQTILARRLAGLITLAELTEMNLADGYAIDQGEYNRNINIQCRLLQLLGRLTPPPVQSNGDIPRDGLADYLTNQEDNFDLPTNNSGRKPSKRHRVQKITRNA